MEIVLGVKRGKTILLLNKKIKKHIVNEKGYGICGCGELDVLRHPSWAMDFAKFFNDRSLCQKCWKKIGF